MPPQGLVRCYEQLREQVLQGREDRSTAMAVLVRQGLWAWMMVIAAEEVHGIGCRESPAVNTPPTSSSMPSFLPASVCGELLVAWTDLLVGVILQKEATG